MNRIARFSIAFVLVCLPFSAFGQGTFTNHEGQTSWHLDKDYAAEMHAASERKHVPRVVIMIKVCPLLEETNGVRARKMVGDRCLDDIDWRLWQGTKMGWWRNLWGMQPVNGWWAQSVNGAGQHTKFYRGLLPPNMPGDEISVRYAAVSTPAPLAIPVADVPEDIFANQPKQLVLDEVPDFPMPKVEVPDVTVETVQPEVPDF